MNIDVPLDLYKVYYTVVKTGNMSQAAKSLYISQPAVSMAIRQLESKLGGILLIRTPKGVRPTSEGQTLFTYLDQALSLISTAEKKYVEMLNLEHGEIKLSASDSILNYYMMPYLERFNKEHENISVKITNRTTGGTLNILKRGEVDLGFVNLPIDDAGAFDILEVAELNEVLVGGKSFERLAKKGVTPFDLKNYPVFLLEKDSNTRKFIDTYLLDQGVEITPIFEIGASDLLLKFAMIDYGLTFIPKQFISNEIENKELFEIHIDPPLPKRHVGLLRLKNVELSNAAKSFAAMFA